MTSCETQNLSNIAALETPESSGRQEIADLKAIIFNLGPQNISNQIDNMERVKFHCLLRNNQQNVGKNQSITPIKQCNFIMS